MVFFASSEQPQPPISVIIADNSKNTTDRGDDQNRDVLVVACEIARHGEHECPEEAARDNKQKKCADGDMAQTDDITE